MKCLEVNIFLVVGKCVYRESGTIYRWSNINEKKSTYWTNYCNGLYSAAAYEQLCQRSIYFLVEGKCVYR